MFADEKKVEEENDRVKQKILNERFEDEVYDDFTKNSRFPDKKEHECGHSHGTASVDSKNI